MNNIVVETTKVSERGQVVIPKEIREKMGLNVGSKLLVLATDEAIIFQKAELPLEAGGTRELVSRAKSLVQRLRLRW